MSGRQHPHRDPAPALAALPEASRRDVLRTMAASLALAAAGCDGPPPEAAIPYVEQPEHLVPGQPLFYATAVTLGGFARPVLAEVHMGRPTRLDGNPQHPGSTGATDPFMQAEVLNLYDPDRPRAPFIDGEAASPETMWARLAALAERLAATGGAGCRVVSGRITSPTLLRQRDAFLGLYPQAGWHIWEPVETPELAAGIRLAFGRDLALHAELGQAAAIVSLGADPLGPGITQVENGAGWAVRRAGIRTGRLPPAPMMVAEATPSLTGLKADSRMAMAEWKLPLLLTAIAQELGEGGTDAVELTLAERAWASRAAENLRRHAGASLLLAGPQLPAGAQALAHRINDRLGNLGRTLTVTGPVGAAADAPELTRLAEDIAAGRVTTLILLDSNLLHAAPAQGDWTDLLAQVPLTVHAGQMRDETGLAAGWQVPLTHPLESWSDARHPDGTVSIVQPTIRPLFGAITVHQFLAALTGASTDPREPVRETWQAAWDGNGLEHWNRALRRGFVEGTQAPRVDAGTGPVEFRPTRTSPPEAVELVIRPDPTIWDGRYANNAWLQELPKPLTRVTWTNVVGLSPALAAELGLGEGDLVEVEAAGRTVVGPAYPLPGQAERTVTLWLGYGRAAGGRNGTGLGYNAARLRPAEGGWRVDAVTLRPVGTRVALPMAQQEGRMHGLDLARAVPLDHPRVETPASAPPPPSLHPDWEYPEHRWAMAVDVDNCIGCNACVVACQAENSVPTVGPEEVKRGRAMHWIRVERYWTDEPGAGGEGQVNGRFLPVLCMHCEKAPCEVGCPVNATVHGPDGLNQMIYNRCIGTRTCAAYCPYEVRRFNYFDYAARDLAAAVPQRNPDVTVRARGVMEKCTYCVQRIRAAEIQAGIEGREIGRDEVTTACASACPSKALIFGDLNDPESAVARKHAEDRAYDLLRELGTRPRTFYLARLTLPEDTA